MKSVVASATVVCATLKKKMRFGLPFGITNAVAVFFIGVAPAWSISVSIIPNQINFPDTLVGSVSDPIPFTATILLQGTEFDPVITQAFAPQANFSLTSDCVGATSSCSGELTFAPTLPFPYATSLTIVVTYQFISAETGLPAGGLFGTGIGVYGQGVLTSPSEVPLPAALPLFATGLGVLGLAAWRRKRKALAA